MLDCLDESEGPSIPSQFQTVVIDNSEKPGFTSRSKRFDTLEYVVRVLFKILIIEKHNIR